MCSSKLKINPSLLGMVAVSLKKKFRFFFFPIRDETEKKILLSSATNVPEGIC